MLYTPLKMVEATARRVCTHSELWISLRTKEGKGFYSCVSWFCDRRIDTPNLGRQTLDGTRVTSYTGTFCSSYFIMGVDVYNIGTCGAMQVPCIANFGLNCLKIHFYLHISLLFLWDYLSNIAILYDLPYSIAITLTVYNGIFPRSGVHG